MRIYNPGDRVNYYKGEVGTIVEKVSRPGADRDTYCVRYDDGTVGDCDEPYLDIAPEPPRTEWVANLTVTFKDGSIIESFFTHVEQDVAWGRLISEMKTSDASSDISLWSVSIRRTEIKL